MLNRYTFTLSFTHPGNIKLRSISDKIGSYTFINLPTTLSYQLYIY
jgi:hypothetical protein